MPTGSLEGEGKRVYEEVYQDRLKACKGKGGSEDKCQQSAAKQAWAAVKNAGWKKDADGNWHKSAFEEFSMRLDRAAYDKGSGERRWKAVASDVDDDSYGDNMTPDLFKAFIQHIENNDQVPEEFRSDFWSGGMPYISVSHYTDQNGNAVPGPVDATYVDGTYLKAKGRFSDTPLGRKCFEAVCADLYNEERKSATDKVRISIAFLDFKHIHKNGGYVFERKSLDDFCPMCLAELIKGESSGRSFVDGQLIHLALTRVPVNKRTDITEDDLLEEESMTTQKEDAASIIGEELANELDETEKSKIAKSMAVVTHSEAEEDKSKSKKDEKAGDEAEMDEEETASEPEDEKDKKKKKEAKKADYSTLMAEIENIKAMIAPAKVESHPLDEVLVELKSKYDEVVKANVTPDEKLHMLQEAYASVGENIIAMIKPVVPEQPNPQADLVKALSAALSETLAPLAQKMDLLTAQLSNANPQRQPQASVVIPQRRGIHTPPPEMLNAPVNPNKPRSIKELAWASTQP